MTSIGEYAFYGCTGLTSIELPNSVTRIAEHAFEKCSSLANITLPNSVTIIGECAFQSCNSLVSIELSCVTNIEGYAFYNCKNIASISIPHSVKSIGKSAFNGCSSLIIATIGYQVETIGEQAFAGCPELKSIINYAKNPQVIKTNTFSTYDDVYLHVLPGCKDAYQSATAWGKFTIMDNAKGKVITELHLDKPYYQIAVGQTQYPQITINPTDAWYQDLVWTSSDPSVLSIDTKTGRITGLWDGVATITVKAPVSNNVSVSANVYVGDAPVSDEDLALGQIENDTTHDILININGLRVNDMSAPGLYIRNGKKIIIQ